MDRIATLEKMLAAEPEDTFVLYSLGQEHAKAGRHEEAIGFYEKCLAANHGEHYAYFHMARSLEASRRQPEGQRRDRPVPRAADLAQHPKP